MKLFQTNNIDGSNNYLKVIVMLLVLLVMVFNGGSDSCGASDGNDIKDGGGVILWV